MAPREEEQRVLVGPSPSRVLLVGQEALPASLVQALHLSPVSLEEVGPTLLGSGEIGKGDSVFIGDVTQLEKVVASLEKKNAAGTLLITIAHPSELQLDEERLRGLQLTVLPRTWDDSQVVRRVLQLVVAHLKQTTGGLSVQPARPHSSAQPLSTKSATSSTVASRRAATPPPLPDREPAAFRLPRPATLREARAGLAGTQRGPDRLGPREASATPQASFQPALSRSHQSVGATPGDTPPTKVSLHAPPSLRAPGMAVHQARSAVAAQVADVLPQPPPASHRRLASRPPDVFSGYAAASIPQAPAIPSGMGLAPHSDAPKVSSQRFSAPPVSTAPDGRTLRATRWVVVDDDEARLQAVATCLRQMGAKVETTALRGFQPKLGALRCFDAIGYIVGERELRSASQLLKVLEGDARLRWMRLVVVRWTEVFEPESTGVSAETLTRSLEQHWESEWESLEQLIQGLELGVERLGIPRILVAVGRLPGPLTLRVASLQHDFALELSEGRLLRLEMDDQAVQPKQLDAGMDQLLQLSEGSAVLEATPQRQSETLAPQGGLAPLGELLRAHAERLGKHSLFSGAAPLSTVGAEEPRVSARWAAFSSWLSAALDPFQGRTVHLKRLAELLRSYRAPIAAGALAMVLACAAMAVLVSRDPSVPRLVAPLRTEAQLNSDAELANPAAANGATRQAATLTGVESQRGALGEPRAEGAEPPSVTAQCEHLGPKGQLPPGQRAAQAKSAWRLGRKSLLVGDLALAAERMCLSALLDPQGAGAADLVRLHFTRGDIPSARAGAEWALAEQPGEPTVKQLLADALNQDGDTEGARQLLLDSMGLPPGESGKIAKVAQRFAVAGNQVLKGGDAAQAERMFRRAVALNRDNLTGTVGLADLLLRRKQVAAASPFAKRAAALGPQNFHAQLLLGEVLSAEGESEAAKAAFQVALRLNPTSARVRQRLGIE